MSFDHLWAALEPIGRMRSGGYRRFAWTDEDRVLAEWFGAEAAARGLQLVEDRAGNEWAWWGDPDAAGPGVVTGSHLDSVPDGGAFDGPLGVVSSLLAVDALRAAGFVPSRPIGIVRFVDEEGARFGVACAGSRLLTGALSPDRARGLRDADGVTMAEAVGFPFADVLGRDDEALSRVGSFVELHVEQGRGLGEHAVGVGSGIRPHGRWRIDLPGTADHAGTTAMADRDDAAVAMAHVVLAAREAALRHGGVATVGKVALTPNGVNAIASHATVWLDARAPTEEQVRAIVGDVGAGLAITEESWTARTALDTSLAALLGDVSVLDTGAGHDAGILAAAGIPAAMLFVRNPTGVSHSPAEFAERDDCLAGVDALTRVLQALAS